MAYQSTYAPAVGVLGGLAEPDPYAQAILTTRRPSAQRLAKRALDLTLASVLLVILLPLLVVIGIAIKLDSRGPILFRQARVGARQFRANGREYWKPRLFTILKFRSMAVDSDEELHKSRIEAVVNGTYDSDHPGPRLKPSDDPRVTRVGRILRRTSLDELPQLLNVLNGTMSLVGPRPVPVYEAVRYTAQQSERLTVLPGITGLWQVSGRADTSYETMVRLDLEYARHRSLRLDLKILLETIPAVLVGRGAA